MKYKNLIKGRLETLETALEDLAMEQAKINSQAPNLASRSHNNHSVSLKPAVLKEDSKFDENALFADKLLGQSTFYDSY